MDNFFCAQESRQAQEDPISTTGWSPDIYVLIECPPPWTTNEFNSNAVPANLRALGEEIKRTELLLRPLLIYSNQLQQESCMRCLIFTKELGLSAGYIKQEFCVQQIEDVALVLRDYLLAGKNLSHEDTQIQTRDILVCTHGSHDKCCAKYGNPFYRQAQAAVSQLSSAEQIRIWQSSHFGGHRFAPTAIDFPQGRHYGRLDQETFTSILTRTGDIQCLKSTYRGWVILPWAVQVLERELILKHGWDWFNYRVSGQVIEHNEDESFNRVELTFTRLDGSCGIYQADVVEEESKTLYLRGECDGDVAEKFSQYSVQNLVMLQQSSVVF